MIKCIILTHGDLGSALERTLEGIMGKQQGLSVISNSGLGRDELLSALRDEVNQERDKDGVIIFVDMFGTSCWQTAKKVLAEAGGHQGRSAVITGVNLPMLVRFFSKRQTLPMEQLVHVVKQEGEKGIRTET
jgi:mannose/fructose-specific phosphotransferase system component IIA